MPIHGDGGALRGFHLERDADDRLVMVNDAPKKAQRETRPSKTMIAILRDFARAPRKNRGENSDGAGHVLIRDLSHYDQRRINALLGRGYIAHMVHCGCGVPCDCKCNGWHITGSGVAALKDATS
jgi:hypothetical protein